MIEPADIDQMPAEELKAEVRRCRAVLQEIAAVTHELFDALDEPSEAERLMPVRVIRPRVNDARARLATLISETTKETVHVHGN